MIKEARILKRNSAVKHVQINLLMPIPIKILKKIYRKVSEVHQVKQTGMSRKYFSGIKIEKKGIYSTSDEIQKYNDQNSILVIQESTERQVDLNKKPRSQMFFYVKIKYMTEVVS